MTTLEVLQEIKQESDLRLSQLDLAQQLIDAIASIIDLVPSQDEHKASIIGIMNEWNRLIETSES